MKKYAINISDEKMIVLFDETVCDANNRTDAREKGKYYKKSWGLKEPIQYI